MRESFGSSLAMRCLETGMHLRLPGLADLLLVARSSMQVFAVANIGSSSRPLFDMRARAIPSSWNHQQLPPDVFVITGQKVALFRNRAIPGRCEFAEPEALELPATIGGFYSVSPVDLNGDGDTDLVYHSSSRITCWVERSFLIHGYRHAVQASAETRR